MILFIVASGNDDLLQERERLVDVIGLFHSGGMVELLRSLTACQVYKVQLGAFVHFDINQYLKETDKNFEGETQDGMNKYTMGNFRDKDVAESFKKDIQKMGIPDAWIVPHIDGTRVTMEEARQYLGKQGR